MAFLDQLKNWFSNSPTQWDPLFGKTIETTYQQNADLLNQVVYRVELSRLPIFQDEVANWPATQKVQFILYCMYRINESSKKKRGYDVSKKPYFEYAIQKTYIKTLLSRSLQLGEEDVLLLNHAFQNYQAPNHDISGWPIKSYLKQFNRQYKGILLNIELIKSFQALRKYIFQNKKDVYYKEHMELLETVDAIIFRASNSMESILPHKFIGEDALADFANPQIDALPLEEKKLWYQIIAQAKKAKAGKPSATYLKKSKALIDELGHAKFKKLAHQWFQFIIDLKATITERHSWYNNNYTWVEAFFLSSPNVETMKGIVWMSSHFHDQETIRLLGDLAQRCYRKVKAKGPAAIAIGNACFYALYQSKGLDGIGQLSKLKSKIKQANAIKIINRYLEQAAEKKGISTQELEDQAIDDYGLIDGKKEIGFGEFTALLEIVAVGKLDLRWKKADGKSQKSVPASVKERQRHKLSVLRQVKKEIEKSVVAQRDRIDRLFRNQAKWNWEAFDQLYLQHGLMSFLSKRIIWSFDLGDKIVTAFHFNDQWVNAQNEAIKVEDVKQVALWHPAEHPLAEVEAWRNFLFEHEIKQPLKQAYREIYPLTDAERQTQSYSNRMAAHVLKQHQFNSLAKVRGWKYSLMGAFDKGYESDRAYIELAEYALRAEYWVSEVNIDDAFNEVGIYNYITTDQVRFVSLDRNQVIDLEHVPPVLFSEIMRDVDLFVGVASVGNDPNWQDSEGEVEQYRNYWLEYSFGDLTGIGKNRHAILEKLLPRLKIKDKVELKDRFLLVHGQLRSYKIHLSSTNILMEPNDQYLCIVPDRRQQNKGNNIFLPFEGDQGLSVILSKAILLVDDDRITDPSIVSQIIRK